MEHALKVGWKVRKNYKSGDALEGRNKNRMQDTSPNNLERLYIFLDEGGDLVFSPKGSKYFTLTSVTMFRPFNMANPLDDLKYDLIEYGIEIEYFHASSDKQVVRDRVFSIIQNNLTTIQIDTLIVEKSKTGPDLRKPTRFFPEMLSYLLQYPFNGKFFGSLKIDDLNEIFVITDTIPLRNNRRAIEKAVKTNLKRIVPAKPFNIFHHSSKSSMELQIADYCNWAIFRKWENGDRRSYDLVKPAINSEFDIFAVGDTKWYEK